MKFLLQAVTDDKEVITHEFKAGTWYDTLDSFVKFLRGCGYSLKDNSVGINLCNHMVFEDGEHYNITYFEQVKE